MIGIAILFVVLGSLVKYGKMYFLIAGYNTMSKEDKEKRDIEGIAHVFFSTMVGIAFVILVGFFIAEWTENPDIKNYTFGIAMLVGIPYLLIKSNSKKYKKNQ